VLNGLCRSDQGGVEDVLIVDFTGNVVRFLDDTKLDT
jgi:hypothetical protein